MYTNLEAKLKLSFSLLSHRLLISAVFEDAHYLVGVSANAVKNI